MRIVLYIVALLFSQFSYSLTPLNKFSHFDESNGLAQAVVSATQDKQGFLWFGTEGNNGVFRYDGVEFIQYKHDPQDPESLVSGSIYTTLTDSRGDIWFGSAGGGISRFHAQTAKFTNYEHIPGDSNSISDNLIYSLLEDSKGNIWISTKKSLDKYSLETDTFTHYYPNSSNINAIVNPIAYHSFESRDGTLWIGTYGGGLVEFDPIAETFKTHSHDPNNPDSIAHNTLGGIVEDSDGYIWIGGKGGLNRLDRKTGKFTRYAHEPGNVNSLLDNFVWDIAIGNDNELWLGGFGGGLARFNTKTGTVTRMAHVPSLKESMSSNLIFCLFIDRTGILWIGTVDGGLNKYNSFSEQFSHFSHIPGDENSFTSASIFTIYQSSDNLIWLGYQGHNNGLTKWDRENNVVENYYPGPDTLEKGEVLSIYEDSKKRLYLGQYKLSIFDRSDHTIEIIFPHEKDAAMFDGKTIRKIVEDEKENLWLATESGLIKVSPDRKSYQILLPDTSIRTLLIDKQGFLWIGTASEGVIKFNIHTGQHIEYIHDHNNSETISSGEVLAIYQDSSSRIWMGLVGGGLNLLNNDGKTFTHYSSADGFSSNTIFSIQQDRNGYLWMGSAWGLIKFHPETGAVKNFTEQDGLQGNEFSIRSDGSIADNTGKLYFVGKKGLTSFDPLAIKLNKTPPPVVLTSVKLFNKEYEGRVSPGYMDNLSLSWQDNMLSIGFAALDYVSPRQNRYMYMMEGFDKDWINAGNNNVATYTNLDGGNYTFKVKASNNHGIWNKDEHTLPVKISTRWWKTWWAYAFYFIAFLALIQYRTSQVEKKKQELEKQVEIRTSELNQSLTNLKETQNQLIESGKMAALGKLVAGVAHEINTPLGIGVTGVSHLHEYTGKLASKLESKELTKEYLEEYIENIQESSDIVLSNLHRAASLVTSFKSVAVDQTSEDIRKFKIAEYINNILNSLTPRLKKASHEVKVIYTHDIEVHTCPGALYQIILNLIENSLIHGFEGSENGVITIKIKQENSRVIIEYRDNGKGVPEDVIPIIFDPFFTTKRNQGGSGLGTHILYNLVTQKMKGKVKCVDTSMNGACFIIEFPCNI